MGQGTMVGRHQPQRLEAAAQLADLIKREAVADQGVMMRQHVRVRLGLDLFELLVRVAQALQGLLVAWLRRA
ncbi:hypothetical protein [Paraburkholderia sp. JPY465]|uniref:hypothetical protein n=1 Tax=Paraburkholderia sp. JPY465 TaxID=3042285 RepID=UPI003D1D26D7